MKDKVYTCMDCMKEFTLEEGTFPQNNDEGEPVFNSDLNNRTIDEFLCYDCAG